MDVISEIKSRIPIEDLVSQYVALKKSGRNFKALCPFHSERTPSFYISTEKQLAYCFGCHKGGDHFKFIEEIEGVDFKGALALLAEKAGVELPKPSSPFFKSSTSQAPAGERKSERERLIALHDHATTFFEAELWESIDGKQVLKYLKKRGLSEEMIRKARLGFAPDLDGSLYTYLLKKDFTRGEILTSGLCIARGTDMSANIADRFRMRLMFPITNLSGAICGFGGRAVKEGDEPKYLNSPETPIYHKSSLLFYLSQARPEIRVKASVIIVEGYMDALASHQAGFLNVVACSGTALTSDQLILLKRFTKEVIFAFDRDSAGIAATLRAIELGFDQDFSMRIAVWKSSAKDPDECIRDNAVIFEEAITHAKSATDYLLDAASEKFDAKSVAGKHHIVDELLPFFAKVKSPLELDEWLKRATGIFELSTQSLYDELKRYQGKQKSFGSSRRLPESNLDPNRALAWPERNLKEDHIYEYLLGLLLTYKETIGVANLMVTPEDFEDSELQNIYISLGTQYNQQGLQLSDKENERANILGMYVEARHMDASWEMIQEEVLETIRMIVRRRFARQKKSLLTEIRKVEAEKKPDLLDLYQDILAKEQRLLTHTDTLWQKN